MTGFLHKALNAAAAVAAIVAVTGQSLAAAPTAQDMVNNARPSTRPFRATSDFSSSLSCMDHLLASYGKQDISVMADNFGDATGTIKVGAREMLIDALASMSETSGAFKFVDLDVGQSNINTMHNQVKGSIANANFYIKGTFVRSDQGIGAWSRRIGVAIQQLSLGTSKDTMVSVIGLDMGIGDTHTFVLFNDVRTSNEISILHGGKGGDAEVLLPFASLAYDVKTDTSEGTHEAVRTLIDLSAIELAGKFTRTPYWKCLAIPATDPMVSRVALSFFDKMKPAEQISAVQTGLRQSGEFAGAADGAVSAQLNDAINRYRVKHTLAAGTAVDFNLYLSLLNEGYTVLPAAPKGKGTGTALDTPRDPALRADPTSDALQIMVEPTSSTVVQGDALRLNVTTTRDAYVYCYATGARENGTGPAIGERIFPNRFTGKQPMLHAGDVLTIPENESDFRFRLNDAGQERVACIARLQPYSAPLPSSLSRPDLVELGKTISEIVYEHQSFDKKALETAVRILDLNVMPRGSQ